ncbi:MAG: DNA primase [Desulfuromonadales bacterium]|nr:DNA primase [Desulfuromonadales bacterium]
MSRSIAEELIQEIRERTDIVEVVSSYLPLKRSGANSLGLCPFHSEKTPSFNVNSTRQIFHCFGCGVGGNVFTFLMRMEGVAFPEAVRRLGEKAGVDVPDEKMTPVEEQRRQEQEKLARINEVAADFYHQLLLDGEEAAAGRRYLRQRGFDAETVRLFRLGYAPEQWDALARHLKEKGFDLKTVREQLGLVRPGKDGRDDFDLFRKRLMIPIYDIRDQVVAFGGRVLDDSLPKYINSPESPIYHKSRILYGLHNAREAMRRENVGIVVEGYFDQMALLKAGFENAVATCGTALTPDHAGLLKRYTDRLLMLFDQDKAGQKATLRSMDVLLPVGVSVAVVTLPDGADPDSFLAEQGGDALRARLDAAQPILEYYIDLTLKECGATIEGRARAVEAIAAKLKLLVSDIERDLYIKLVAERTGLDVSLLYSRIAAVKSPEIRGEKRPPPVQKTLLARPKERGEKVPDAVVRAQATMLRLIFSGLVTPAVIDQELLDELFPGDLYREIAALVVDVFAAGAQVESDRLHPRLSPGAMELLASIESTGSDNLEEDPEAIFAGCRLSTRKYSLTLQGLKLKGEMAKALQEGEIKEHEKLQGDYMKLKKKEKKL